MQSFVRELPGCDPKTATATPLKRTRSESSIKNRYLNVDSYTIIVLADANSLDLLDMQFFNQT